MSQRVFVMEKKSRKTDTEKKKGRVMSAFTGLSGTLSFLGGWQVCHNLCLGIIALLSVIGITVVGMPLLFLTQSTVYFWSLAVLILVPTILMYWRNRKCMSVKLVLFNVGIVIASVPFVDMQPYQIVFWLIGGTLILGAAWMFLKPKLANLRKQP